jgi:hypothetical protein
MSFSAILYFFSNCKTDSMLSLILSMASLLVGTSSWRERVIGRWIVSGSPVSSPFPTTVMVWSVVSVGSPVGVGMVLLIPAIHVWWIVIGLVVIHRVEARITMATMRVESRFMERKIIIKLHNCSYYKNCNYYNNIDNNNSSSWWPSVDFFFDSFIEFVL